MFILLHFLLQITRLGQKLVSVRTLAGCIYFFLFLTQYFRFVGLTAKADERNLLQREDNDVDSNLVIADDIFHSLGVSDSSSSSPVSNSQRERYGKFRLFVTKFFNTFYYPLIFSSRFWKYAVSL